MIRFRLTYPRKVYAIAVAILSLLMIFPPEQKGIVKVGEAMSLQRAIERAKPGDTIILESADAGDFPIGIVRKDDLVIMCESGPIVIPPGSQPAITIAYAQGVTFVNCDIRKRERAPYQMVIVNSPIPRLINSRIEGEVLLLQVDSSSGHRAVGFSHIVQE